MRDRFMAELAKCSWRDSAPGLHGIFEVSSATMMTIRALSKLSCSVSLYHFGRTEQSRDDYDSDLTITKREY